MAKNDVDNIIVLDDENGNEVEFEFLDLIEYKGEEYIVLFPLEPDEETEGTVVILKIEDAGDEEAYVGIKDNDTLQAVFGIFKERFKDELKFD